MKEDNKLNSKQLKKIIEYWINVAEHDFETMVFCFRAERVWSLEKK